MAFSNCMKCLIKKNLWLVSQYEFVHWFLVLTWRIYIISNIKQITEEELLQLFAEIISSMLKTAQLSLEKQKVIVLKSLIFPLS